MQVVEAPVPGAECEERGWGLGSWDSGWDILSLLAQCHWDRDPPANQKAGTGDKHIDSICGALFMFFFFFNFLILETLRHLQK